MILKFLIPLSGGLLFIGSLLLFIYFERKKNRFSPFTERMLRSPGYTLNQKLQDLSDDLLAPVLMVGFIPIIYALFFLGKDIPTQLIGGVITLTLMGYAFYKIRKIFTESQKIKLGMYGEIYTGQELNYLMQKGAWVYHDIPYQYGNIDHIIISKAGVFAVETKAVRKPLSKKGGRDAKVVVTKNKIIFPHVYIRPYRTSSYTCFLFRESSIKEIGVSMSSV